jgi:hypothetical protein
MSLHGWKLYVLLAWILLVTLSTGLSLVATHNDVDAIDARLKTAKVCSDTNRGQACIDLFNRLARSITEAQRDRLACVVFQHAKVKPNINCPVIKPNEGKP